MPLLPTNLAVKLIEQSLPWNCATQFHVDAFLEAYTLHDSNWITLHLECGWEDAAVAVINFDPVWNPSVIVPTSVSVDWPLLFLRFMGVSSVQMAGFSDIGGLQRSISSVSVEHPTEEDVVTTVLDHYGGSVQIEHFPLLEALAMNSDGAVIPLSNSVTKHSTGAD